MRAKANVELGRVAGIGRKEGLAAALEHAVDQVAGQAPLGFAATGEDGRYVLEARRQCTEQTACAECQQRLERDTGRQGRGDGAVDGYGPGAGGQQEGEHGGLRGPGWCFVSGCLA